MVRPVIQRGELSGSFVVRDPKWREKIFFGGLLVLIVHPVGWPVALGYRKDLIKRLFNGEEPLLPEWDRKIGYFFLEGLKAMAVIFGYLLPLYVILLCLLLSNGISPNIYWLYALLFFVMFTIFSTLSFPAAVIYWTFFSESYQLSLALSFGLLAVFSLVIFFIPAGFLQVSKTGKYLSAFNVRAGTRTLANHFTQYVSAWYHSIVMSLAGHFSLPFSPWGVFWCYLGIIFEFNSILAGSAEYKNNKSWFERLEKDKIHLSMTNLKNVLVCEETAGSAFPNAYFFKLGPILIPLPNIVVSLVRARPA